MLESCKGSVRRRLGETVRMQTAAVVIGGREFSELLKHSVRNIFVSFQDGKIIFVLVDPYPVEDKKRCKSMVWLKWTLSWWVLLYRRRF